MVAAIGSATPLLFLNAARVQNLRGHVSVPVEPMYAIQAHFKHLQGVPTRGEGIPLFKLRVLDNLIDRLLSFGERITIPAKQELAAPSEAQLQPLMASLEERLRSRLLQSPGAFGGAFPETGILFELAA